RAGGTAGPSPPSWRGRDEESWKFPPPGPCIPGEIVIEYSRCFRKKRPPGSCDGGNLTMFAKLIETLKANPRTLVFTEGADARILEATHRLKKDGFLTPILVGDEAEVKAAAAKGGFDIEGVRIVNPATYAGMDAMVDKMVELRKGKMTPEECRANLMKGNYFGTMLVKMGEADCLLGGAT